MRVGWIQDAGNADGTQGGAELTMAEYQRAAPKDAELLVGPEHDVDVWVVGNCVQYSAKLIEALRSAPVVSVVHDLKPHGDTDLKDWLNHNALNVFCSPLHRRRFPHPDVGRWTIIPPPAANDKFRTAGRLAENRRGTVWVGNFMYGGKGAQLAAEWAEANQEVVRFYGHGPHGPDESKWVARYPAVEYDEVPSVLAGAERFLFLPTKPEPFGRSVVEAWAAGCELVLNRNVGARYFIEDAPGKLETAAHDFWSLVVREAS